MCQKERRDKEEVKDSREGGREGGRVFTVEYATPRAPKSSMAKLVNRAAL